SSVSATPLTVDLPEATNYAGYRSRQVLHHFSEVIKAHLDARFKKKPKEDKAKAAKIDKEHEGVEEVQAGYQVFDGEVYLSISANEYYAQEYLSRLGSAKWGEIFEEAARGGTTAHAQQSALKILGMDDQEQARARVPGEDPDDTRLAAVLSQAAL